MSVTLEAGGRRHELSRRPWLMGIVNASPDSFSDGGVYATLEARVALAAELLAAGADVIDVGGESGRTNLPPVAVDEEIRRVVPLVERVAGELGALVSVDTYKPAVAAAALAAGASIVNDVSGLRWDSQMARTIAEIKCGAVLMHMRGRPEEWRNLPPPGDIVLLVKRELREWVEAAVLAGVRRERIALDPGFGFGKNFEQNYELIARLPELRKIGCAILIGTSRKGFLGHTLGKQPGDRIWGTAATIAASILGGAHIVRVHDVAEMVQVARVSDNILAGSAL